MWREQGLPVCVYIVAKQQNHCTWAESIVSLFIQSLITVSQFQWISLYAHKVDVPT